MQLHNELIGKTATVPYDKFIPNYDGLNSKDRIFIRKPTADEKRGGLARHRGFAKITPKDGYEIVYCPYGNTGNSADAGYYYAKLAK